MGRRGKQSPAKLHASERLREEAGGSLRAPRVGKGCSVHSEEELATCSSGGTDSEESFRLANRAQRAEIMKHREALMRRLGRIVSLDEAVRDWIDAHAASWRAEFEKKTTRH